MLFRHNGILILEVPKCGSRTLVKAAKKTWGNNELAGHLSIVSVEQKIAAKRKSHRVDWEIREVLRIVREPKDRLLSAFNYGAQGKKFSLDTMYKQFLSRNPKALTSTQSFWSDTDRYPITTFTLDEIDKAIDYIGYEGPPLHENPSEKVFTWEEIESHPKYEELLRIYEPDFELWSNYA